MKKKLFIPLSVAALLPCTPALAGYDYPYMWFQTTDGTTQSVSVESLRLTFEDGQAVVTNGAGTYTFQLSTLSKMYFSEKTSSVVTAIEAATAEGGVEVYTVTGLLLGRYASAEAARRALPKGIYVFKSNDKTYKTTIR